MGVTPARHAREQQRVEAEKEAGRRENEDKFTEFDLGCAAGSTDACNSLGEWYSLMKQDFGKAAQLYTSACFQARHPQACMNLGHMLLGGRGEVGADPPRALAAFTLGCEAGNPDSCSNAGKLLLQQAVGPTQADAGHKQRPGAAPPASSATPLHAPQHVLSAERMLRTGCEGGNSSTHAKCCGMLAALHMSPRFAAVEFPRLRGQPLLQLLHNACAGEHTPSCSKLALLYRRGAAPELGIDCGKDEALADRLEVQSLRWMGMSEARAGREVERRKALLGNAR